MIHDITGESKVSFCTLSLVQWDVLMTLPTRIGPVHINSYLIYNKSELKNVARSIVLTSPSTIYPHINCCPDQSIPKRLTDQHSHGRLMAWSEQVTLLSVCCVTAFKETG